MPIFMLAAEGATNSLITEVGTALGTIIDWCGTVITALTGADGDLNALLPLWAVGIGISALLLGVKIIRSFAWGN